MRVGLFVGLALALVLGSGCGSEDDGAAGDGGASGEGGELEGGAGTGGKPGGGTSGQGGGPASGGAAGAGDAGAAADAGELGDAGNAGEPAMGGASGGNVASGGTAGGGEGGDGSGGTAMTGGAAGTGGPGTFEMLGLPAAGISVPVGPAWVSADGSVVATSASVTDEGQQAVRFSDEDGALVLEPPAGWQNARVTGISADGRVIIGAATNPTAGEAPSVAVRWVLDAPGEALGVPDGDLSSQALVVAADGSVIAGTSVADAEAHAFVWTEGSGLEAFGGVGAGLSAVPSGISADGTLVVGTSLAGATPEAGFFWQDGIVTDLLPDPADSNGSAAAVNADGTVIVGASITASDARAVRWVDEAPEIIDPALDSAAQAVSADGSVVYVLGNPGSGPNSTTWGEPAIWSEGSGLLPLENLEDKFACVVLLPSARSGADLAGFCGGPPEPVFWNESGVPRRMFDDVTSWGYDVSALGVPIFATAVSADGKVIVGWASSDLFVVRLP